MTDANSIPDAVLWHEGMLLSPQHFQQAELRTHALRSYLIQAAAPFGWGVRRLRIDTAALEAGRFSVTELEAILPDGLLVVYPTAAPAKAPALELDLKPLLANAGTQTVAVHVTVAAQSTPANGLGIGQKQRFREIVGTEVADANTGDSAIVIPRLIPNPGLEATDGPLNPPSPARMVSIPLAVLRSDGQRFTRSDDYEPPRLRVEEETGLFTCAKAVETALATKANDWAGRLRGAMAEGEAGTVGDSIVTLRTIVRGLPRLGANLKTLSAHPFEVYLALCDIAGELAVTGGELTNPNFEQYHHADPLAAFRAAAKFILDALERLHTPYTSEAFEHLGAGKFELTLRPVYLRDDQVTGYLRDRLVIGVRYSRSQSVEAVRRWFQSARIAAAADIDTLDLNRSAGAVREEIQSDAELGLLPQPQMVLFRVVPEPDLLSVGQALQVSLPPDEAPSDGVGDGPSEPDRLVLFIPIPDPNARAGKP